MSECTHDCSTCGESCGERKEANVFEKKPLRPGCRVGKVYGIVSGKGGAAERLQRGHSGRGHYRPLHSPGLRRS